MADVEPVSLVLASSSPYRKRLLEQLGLRFITASPDVDEAPVQTDPQRLPEQKALCLAELKASAVAAQYPGKIVIGSDQIACLEGKILTKPGDAENNLQQLKELSGKTHLLITAVVVLAAGKLHSLINTSRMTMRVLSPSERERYVAADRAWDCAGGYRWESLGISLFEQIETSDTTAILGLPLIELTTLLRSLGVQIP